MKIGKNCKIYTDGLWGDCEIGDDCVIGRFVEIGDKVEIGNGCKVESGCFLCKGVMVGFVLGLIAMGLTQTYF